MRKRKSLNVKSQDEVEDVTQEKNFQLFTSVISVEKRMSHMQKNFQIFMSAIS